MDIKCRINGKDYDSKLVQGITISEDYGETLDSGSIILAHIPKIDDLRPYDDVYLYSDEFPTIESATSGLQDVSATIENKDTYSLLKFTFNKDFVNAITNYIVWVRRYSFIKFNGITSSVYYFTPTISCVGDNIYIVDERGGFTYNGQIRNNDGSITIVMRTEHPSISFSTSDKSFTYRYWAYKRVNNNKFYKHFLVDQFTEEILNLEDGIYKYKIELFSETKGLEVVQLPNSSVTEPLIFSKKITIYDYICKYLYLYSPIIKVEYLQSGKTFKYRRKYSIAPELKDAFGKIYCQDFTLTNPTLREVLTQLFITKDYIPVIKDNVLTYLDKTKRNGYFHNCDKGVDELKKYVNFITGSLSSDNYTDNLRRPYQNAIGNPHSCHSVEYIGFRNSNDALLTLSGLKLETRYPIYKINKMLMCYYKDITYTNTNTGEIIAEKRFLCKQNITPFIKLNSERNLLSQDWEDFYNTTIETTKIEDLVKYKFATIGYDIGSNTITGWGESYSYASGFWDYQATYIENIFRYMDYNNRYGITPYTTIQADDGVGIYVPKCNGTYSHTSLLSSDVFDVISSSNDSSGAKIKSIFFEIEYEPMYSGAIIHSKDAGRDNITFSDGGSSALALLEKDGLAQKEKINSLGNKTIHFTARYNGDDISQLQDLGSVYEYNGDTDIIIYHKEYSIYDNFISCSYIGAKDYVLKNFYTSVYAKHRPNKLMSYEESISRSENSKVSILLSKNNLYYENPTSNPIKYKNLRPTENGGYTRNIIQHLLNIFSQSEGYIGKIDDMFNSSNDLFISSNNINYGVFTYNGRYFVSDVTTFVSGHSLCLGLQIPDNVTSGVYIKKLVSETNVFSKAYQEAYAIVGDLDKAKSGTEFSYNVYSILTDKNAYTGSVQDWYMIADEDTGNAYAYNFYFGHRDKDKFLPILSNEKGDDLIDKTLKLPLLSNFDYTMLDNCISKNDIVLKDNKERLDVTLQFELMQDYNTDVYFSSWMLKLSDLLGVYYKNPSETKKEWILKNYCTLSWDLLKDTIQGVTISPYTDSWVIPSFTLVLDNETYNRLKEGETIDASKDIDGNTIKMEWKNDITNIQEYTKSETDFLNIYKFYYGMTIYPKELQYFTKTYKDTTFEYIYLKTSSIAFDYVELANGSDGKPGGILTQGQEIYSSKWVSNNSLYYTTGIVLGLTQSPNLYVFKSAMNDEDTPIWQYYNTNSTIKYVPYYFLEQLYIQKDTTKELSELTSTTHMDTDTGDLLYPKPIYFLSLPNHTSEISTYVKTSHDSGNSIKKQDFAYDDKKILVDIIKTMQCTYSKSKMNQDIEYMEIENFNNTTDFIALDVLVNEVFSIQNNGIQINLSKIPTDAKSVQYWFYDDEAKCYHFVFGVNLTDEDKVNGQWKNTIKIYASLVTSKDKRVFDLNNQPIGEIINYAKDNTYSFGEDQYFIKK